MYSHGSKIKIRFKKYTFKKYVLKVFFKPFPNPTPTPTDIHY